MNTVTMNEIRIFLNTTNIAIAGLSRNSESFSAQVLQHLQANNYTTYAVNNHFETESVESRQCKSILNLPNNVNHLLVLTPKDQTFNVICDAVQKGIRYIWIQQSSETPEAIEYATKNGISLITGQCIFMFVNPKGMHKFHYQLKRLFKSLPA